MSNRFRVSVIAVSLVVVLYVLIGGVLGQTTGQGAYKQLAVFSEVLSRIRSEYVEAPDLQRVTAGALHGLLESLDPYSAYFTPHEFAEYQARKDKDEGGVGLVLSKRGYITVISTLPNSPAARADLRTGHPLESIAGFTTQAMSVEQAYLLLAGEPGTAVSIAVIRSFAAEPAEMELVRARQRPTQVVTTELEEGIGYLKVASFPEGKTEEIRAALTRLQDEGAHKLVLDLRGAASGEMSEGIESARLFLESGLITYTQGQQSPRKDFNADPAKTAWKSELVVLINRGTAGPAEVVASAVLENKRGEVLGERSYGKGSVQQLIPLEDGAALILSIAKYHSRSGKALQDEGVTPSVAVAPPGGAASGSPLLHAPPAPGDPVVLKALELLRSEQAARSTWRPAA